MIRIGNGWRGNRSYYNDYYNPYFSNQTYTTQPLKRANLPTSGSPLIVAGAQPVMFAEGQPAMLAEGQLVMMPQKEFVLWRDSFFLNDEYNDFYASSAETKSNQTIPKYDPPVVSSPVTAPKLQTPSELLFSQGIKSFSSKRYSEALNLFTQLVKINPENTDYQAGYGLSNLVAGNYEKAFDALTISSKQAGEKVPNLKQFCSSPNDLKIYQNRLKIYLARNSDVDGKEILDLFDN